MVFGVFKSDVEVLLNLGNFFEVIGYLKALHIWVILFRQHVDVGT